MPFRKAVTDLLAKAKHHFAGQPDEAGERAGMHQQQHSECIRRTAETEIILARAGKAGYFKVYPSETEKVVFNIWVSDRYKDRRGNPLRKIFPKVHYQNGDVIERVVGKGPSLPIGILYGQVLDPSRFPEEDRALLNQFARAIARGIERYEEDRDNRTSVRLKQAA